MQSGDWEKVKDVLSEVLVIAKAERAGFLDRAGLDAATRAEVESLLLFEEGSGELMQLSAVEFSKDFVGDEVSMSGRSFGPYRLVRELGMGGMGAVYLAERVDGKFQQTVALKLLKRELNTAALRRHFEQEREILASLDHPNIARLLDAGTSADNIPYIAMEYVDGVPIDEYCDSNGLDLDARLDLFRTVCAAVEFAHRNLVIHRDLKPSNVLVTNDGVPKLLDFGIAKIISSELADTDAATITRMGVMTPSYASPEQLKRESVTTLSDVYSLGVILFELLSGHRPFEETENDPRKIYSAVLEKEPQLPSSLRTKEATASSAAAQAADAGGPETRPDRARRTDASRIVISSQSLRGDLDNIVLKALRKEPERRYASPERLADDVERHQQGLTVTARPNTFAYRASKFMGRNRAGVLAGVLLTAAVVAGVGSTLWQARVAQSERARAERRFEDVRRLANSFLLEFSPKIERLPGSTDARRLLVERALEYLGSLEAESGGDKDLRRDLAKAYEKVGDVQGSPFNPNIGDTKGALASYTKALAYTEELAAAEPNDLALLADLAYLNKAIGQIHSIGGEYKLSEPFSDKALALHEQLVARDPSVESRAKLGEMLRQRGLLPFYEGDNKKALEYYHRAREVNEQLIKERPDDPRIAEQHAFIYTAIGEAMGWDNDFEGAGPQLQKGVDLLEPLVAKFPNDLAIRRSMMLAYNKRAENYQDLEIDDLSVATFQKGAAIAEGMRRADPQSVLAIRDVAMSYKKLAQAMNDAGQSAASAEKLAESLKLFEEITRIDPTNTEAPYDVANTRLSLGNSYLSMKKFDLAVETFEKAAEEFKAVLATTPQNVYARRMAAHNYEAMGLALMEMSKGGGESERTRAAAAFKLALNGFNDLKASGNLGEVDEPKLTSIQNHISALESSSK